MKVSPAETESVLRLLAATPRRIASLSQGIEISNLHFRRRQDSWSVYAGSGIRPVSGVIALAPHVMVEGFGLVSIRQARENYLTTNLKQKLARYHDDPDSAFWGWNNIWLHPDFPAWNIEEYLSRISCPVLAMQGEDDEYGTMEQIERIADKAPRVELLKLIDCGHSPHRDQPEVVIQAAARFVNRRLSI